MESYIFFIGFHKVNDIDSYAEIYLYLLKVNTDDAAK